MALMGHVTSVSLVDYYCLVHNCYMCHVTQIAIWGFEASAVIAAAGAITAPARRTRVQKQK